MKRIRYLTLLCLLLGSIASWAQFNPANPAEPGQLPTKLFLKATPQGAGSVSGGGSFVAGTMVTVRASANSGWEFVNWTDEGGTVVAATSTYTFAKGNTNETLTAHFAFNPGAPGEPGELPHKLTLVAGSGGSVSGGGFYLNGKTVNIRASANSGYEFTGWYDANGNCISTEASTTYTMGSEAVTLTARFAFNPGSPSEPGEVNVWRLKLTAQDGGTVSASKYNLKEGETITVRASANSGYVFSGWYQEGTKLSDNASFDYTMPGQSVTLEARFTFMPNDPGEPEQIKQRKFSFTLKNVITKPGTTAQFPILLTPLATLGDITFQLNFNPLLDVDIDNVVLAETSTPYTLTREAVVEGDPGYDEAMTSYRFTLTGGSLVVAEGDIPKVTPILTFPVIVPADIVTASGYKISINQISMTLEDGTTQTAGTRNGRLSVYKNGDANGDDVVSITDAVAVVNSILGNPSDNFIEEVANVNDDEGISIVDVVGVVNIILGDNSGSRLLHTDSHDPD